MEDFDPSYLEVVSVLGKSVRGLSTALVLTAGLALPATASAVALTPWYERDHVWVSKQNTRKSYCAGGEFLYTLATVFPVREWLGGRWRGGTPPPAGYELDFERTRPRREGAHRRGQGTLLSVHVRQSIRHDRPCTRRLLDFVRP